MMNNMDRVLGITILLSCLFVARSDVVDLKPPEGSEISEPLTKAWEAACAAPAATTILIPKGTYTLKEVYLKGPCKAPIEIQNEGTVNALPDPGSITKDKEWIMIENMQFLTLSGKGLYDGKGGDAAWKQSDGCQSAASCNKLPNSFAMNFVTDSTIKDITSKDSKLFHIVLFACKNFTVQGVTISAPATAPNTDGIHVGRSSGVSIIDCHIQTGDDCISLGDGSQQVTVKGCSCGPGHGYSVGSLGKYNNEEPVTGVTFSDCTMANTDNGVRVKSWAGPNAYPLEASDIHFENIKMENVTNPIIIDQEYCPGGRCPVDPPSKVTISKVSFKGITGTAWTPEVVKLTCSKTNPCKDVTIGTIDLKYIGPPGMTTGTFAGPPRGNCTNVTPLFEGTQNPPVCK